jgi:3'-phosphoadenosine 5'-phosphosulfate sulfotransferase (PAPS reductase)/FAD synthetase
MLQPDWKREAEVWVQTAGYQRRIQAAAAAIREADSHAGSEPLVVSTSWGKDSVVCLDLAIRNARSVLALHFHSPVSIPGGEHIPGFFEPRCKIEVVQPRYTPEEYIERLRAIGGTFLERVEAGVAAASIGLKAKVGLADEWMRQSGMPVQCLGIRAEESRVRRMVGASLGPVHRLAKGWINAYPIIWLKVTDIWAYIWQHGLPYHRLYDCETHGWTRRTLRNGGIYTLKQGEQVAWMQKHFPESYSQLTRQFPGVRRYT